MPNANWVQIGTLENQSALRPRQRKVQFIYQLQHSCIILSFKLTLSLDRQIRLIIITPNCVVKNFIKCLLTQYSIHDTQGNENGFYINISEFSPRKLHSFLDALSSAIEAHSARQPLPTTAIVEQFQYAKRRIRTPNLAMLNLILPRTNDATLILPRLLHRVAIPHPRSTRREATAPEHDAGENAKRLEEIGYKGEIPETYCCHLSTQIMTDPVYDPQAPQYKFERSWIETALKQKSENPFTRTSLTKEGLVSDASLKEEIQRFVEQLTNQHSQQAGPSMRL